MFTKIWKFLARHKIIVTLLVLAVAGGGYYEYTALNGAKTETKYVLAAAEKGTIISSISGSGQVSVSNQTDVKPKASGDIIYLGAKVGQTVKAGQILAQLDATDALKTVRDAQSSLDSAKLSLAKLQKPVDALSETQAEDDLTAAQEAEQKATDDLSKSYDDGFNSVSDAFLDLPGIMSGLDTILFSNTMASNQFNIDFLGDAIKSYDPDILLYQNDARAKYNTAKASYDKNFGDYKAANRDSGQAVTDNLISETYATTTDISEAIKSANNLYQFYEDKLTEQNLKPVPLADTYIGQLGGYTGQTNGHLSDLLNIKNTIKNSKDTITSSERTITERTQSIAKLNEGTDPLDLQSAELSIKDRENALLDAQEQLADYYVRAPFDGIIAKMDPKKGDSASASTVIATLISPQPIAQITLNEVDVAKIKTGEKATLTFDALPDLSITGVVTDIDTLGTVSQGVVSYIVKISFDTKDDSVKTGMSVTADIITDVRTDVVTVPNSAVKTQGTAHYVEMPQGADATDAAANGTGSGAITLTLPPVRQTVEVGLANDTSTEITSGLKEGDIIVTSTVTSSAAKPATTAAATSGLRIPGLTGGAGAGGGGGFRGGAPAGR